MIHECETNDLGLVMTKKVMLVAGARGTKTLRDFGGLYLVHGKYLLEPAIALQAEYACMVDVTPVPEFDEQIAKAKQECPGLEIEFVNADFRNPDLYKAMKRVDTSILYEVLLHQETYISVIKDVASKTDKYLCIAQPCLKESCFAVPSSACLLQFWPEELKNQFREGSFWPQEPHIERFETRYWMWGHTTGHLMDVCKGLGWELEHGELITGVYGPKWDYSLLRFVRCKE
jgi:hypothetical protein